MSTIRSQVVEWIDTGGIPEEKVDEALTVADITPDGNNWRCFIDLLLLWLGGLSLAFAALFFVAYNWSDIGPFAKFGMVEGFMVLSIILYCKFAEGSALGKVALLGAIISIGVLLALYGQTYQTGADPWQLFFTWAMLMLPWAIISRFPAIWIVWAVLINISVILYYRTFGSLWFFYGAANGALWLLFTFNTLLLAAWEFLSKKWQWLSERWAVRLLAIGGGAPLTWLIVSAVIEDQSSGWLAGFIWVIWLAAMGIVYRKITFDLFMLAGCCLSVITVVTTLLGRYLLGSFEAGGFLLIALAVIGMGAGSAVWLKSINEKEGQA